LLLSEKALSKKRENFKEFLLSQEKPFKIVCSTKAEEYDCVNTFYKIYSPNIVHSFDSIEIVNSVETPPLNIVRKNPYFFETENFCGAILKITKYPSLLKTHFLVNLLIPNTEICFSFFPVPQNDAIYLVRKKLSLLEGYLMFKAKNKLFNNSINVAENFNLEQLQQLYADLIANKEKLVFTNTLILVKAKTFSELQFVIKKVQYVLKQLQIQFEIANYEHHHLAQYFLDAQYLSAYDNMLMFATSTLSYFYPFMRISQSGTQILIGKDFLNNQKIVIDLSKLTNMFFFVLGIPGSGKSFAVKSIIKRLKDYKKIFILDVIGEYEIFNNLYNVKVINANFENFFLNTDFYDCFLIIDEAWKFFQSPIIKERLIEIIKSYRKRGVGLFIITQNLKDLKDDQLIEFLLNNCMNSVIMQINDYEINKLQEYLHLQPYVTKFISQLQRGQGYLKLGTQQYAFTPIFQQDEYHSFNTNFEERKGVIL